MAMYLEMIRIRFLMMLAYRVNYYSGIIIYTINIGAYYFLYQAIYGDKGSIGGLDLQQMTTYIAMGWMARAFYFNNVDREIAMEIREGCVAIEMIRPYHYLVMKVMQALGEGIFRFFFFSLPGVFLAYLLFPIRFPDRFQVWAFFILSLFFSFLINTQINLLTGLITFFLFNNEGFMRAKRVIVELLSGLLIPISFFPDWARAILSWLPFQSISYVPSMIITEGFLESEIWRAIAQQGLWFLLLNLPIFLLWIMARKNLVVQGG